MCKKIDALIDRVETIRAKAINFPRHAITPSYYVVVEQLYNQRATIKVVSEHKNTLDAMLSLTKPGVVATLDSNRRPLEFFDVTAKHIEMLRKGKVDVDVDNMIAKRDLCANV